VFYFGEFCQNTLSYSDYIQNRLKTYSARWLTVLSARISEIKNSGKLEKNEGILRPTSGL